MDEFLKMKTTILPVDARKIGEVRAVLNDHDLLDALQFQLDDKSSDAGHLLQAAALLQHSDIPVAFPTETVYGLGADATRSAAVNGIYRAKQRPSDNPLIVHFASLKQLRELLEHGSGHKEPQVNGHFTNGNAVNGYETNAITKDSIPKIYHSLISKFWPGPLTIILPNPPNSPLAPEVTAGLKTFGARIPKHILALALIQMANVPIAAPSANASTKPSPTAAEHVAYDLDGRIETIIDGGPCDVGVESTVVDGLSDPPLILRPGGISIEQLRSCPGWEDVQIGYKNASESGSQPKAPGMKYRHYSPKAPVILYETSKSTPTLSELSEYVGSIAKLGIVTTKRWKIDATSPEPFMHQHTNGVSIEDTSSANKPGFAGMLETSQIALSNPRAEMRSFYIKQNKSPMHILSIALGYDTANVARGIFSALRELDRENVGAIFVEGIDDLEGDTAAAVMNRLRKAAEANIAG